MMDVVIQLKKSTLGSRSLRTKASPAPSSQEQRPMMTKLGRRIRARLERGAQAPSPAFSSADSEGADPSYSPEEDMCSSFNSQQGTISSSEEEMQLLKLLEGTAVTHLSSRPSTTNEEEQGGRKAAPLPTCSPQKDATAETMKKDVVEENDMVLITREASMDEHPILSSSRSVQRVQLESWKHWGFVLVLHVFTLLFFLGGCDARGSYSGGRSSGYHGGSSSSYHSGGSSSSGGRYSNGGRSSSSSNYSNYRRRGGGSGGFFPFFMPWGHRQSYNNGEGGEGGGQQRHSPLATILSLIFWLAIIGGILYCCFRRWGPKNGGTGTAGGVSNSSNLLPTNYTASPTQTAQTHGGAGSSMVWDTEHFRRQVDAARNRVVRRHSGGGGGGDLGISMQQQQGQLPPHAHPSRGTYRGQYMEDGTVKDVTLTLEFHPVSRPRRGGGTNGFLANPNDDCSNCTIHGYGQDSVGPTLIQEGKVNQWGEAYWVETATTDGESTSGMSAAPDWHHFRHNNTTNYNGSVPQQDFGDATPAAPTLMGRIGHGQSQQQPQQNRPPVLTTGRFDVLRNTFEGRYEIPNGFGGRYTLSLSSAIPAAVMSATTPAVSGPSFGQEHVSGSASTMVVQGMPCNSTTPGSAVPAVSVLGTIHGTPTPVAPYTYHQPDSSNNAAHQSGSEAPSASLVIVQGHPSVPT